MHKGNANYGWLVFESVSVSANANEKKKEKLTY